MKQLLSILATVMLAGAALTAAEALIVADEIPAMEILAAKMKAEEKIASTIVYQTNMPSDLSRFSAVIVYIHRGLNEAPEKAMIEYTRSGGRLIALHHSISSGKRKNKEWFPFLGIDLPPGPVEQGGYKWTEGVTLEYVSLEPKHFITTHKISYPDRIPYQVKEASEVLPGFKLEHSEVYLNHTFTEPRTTLLGLKYTDEKTGKTYMQDRGGWIRPVGKGLIVYFMPGHRAEEFQHPVYSRLILNALIFKP